MSRRPDSAATGSLHRLGPASGGGGRGGSGRIALRDGATEADRDGRRGLAGLGRELRDPARGQAEGRSPDVDRGDDVAAGVVDRRRDRVEPELVLADRGRVAAPPDAGELLEERLELGDGPLRIA